MVEKLLQVILLAAFSDGEVQKSELSLLNSLRTNNKLFKTLTDKQIDNVINDIASRLSSGGDEKSKVISMLEEVSRSLSDEEKTVAYALSAEMCASNFRLLPVEDEFLEIARQILEVPVEQSEIVHRSIELRYGKISF